MNESISDAILDSGEESILRAYTGLSITAGGVSLQRSELPQSVTVAGALNNEGDPTTVVYLNFVDKDVWSTGKIATAAELIAGRYSKFKLNIVTEKPAEGDFYTVCIGTTEALKEYAASQGLVFDPENPDTKMKTAFAEVNRDLSQNMGDQFVDTYTIMSIGDQLSALLADECPGIGDYSPITLFSESSTPVVFLSFVDGEMWSEMKQSRTIELLQRRCKKKGVSITFVTEKPESGKYSTVYVGSASVLKAYGADEDLSKQDYSDGVAYADTEMGLFGVRDYISPREVNLIAKQICNLTGINLVQEVVPITEDALLQNDTSTYFNGTFAGGSSAIFAKQSGNTVNFYAGGSSWGSSLAMGSGWDALGAGDFDGDGKDDVLRINDGGYVVAELSNGSGTFTPQVLNMKGVGWCAAGIGDFNGNGKDDVLLINPTGASMTTGLVGYWESGSTWTLINGYSPEWECVATGDFNADGKCDMLWKKSFQGYDSYCSWLVGVDQNVNDWNLVSNTAPGETWEFLCSGDFNGDGTDDVALINGSGVVGVWTVSNGTMSSWIQLNNSSNGIDQSTWTFGGVGDFDADGWDDIAWCNNSTNSVNYWSTYNIQIDPDNNNGNNWKTIGTIA